MAKFVEIELNEDCVENVDHNYYAKLKPTLFILRFLGGPTGLWRLYSIRSSILTIISKVLALLMLLILNVGTVMGCYMTIYTNVHEHFKYTGKTYVFFSLLLDFTGIMGKKLIMFFLQMLMDYNSY